MALPNTLWIVLAKKASIMKIEPITRDCFGWACMSALIVVANLVVLVGLWAILSHWLLSPDTVFISSPSAVSSILDCLRAPTAHGLGSWFS
jgi:hypothetical protein